MDWYSLDERKWIPFFPLIKTNDNKIYYNNKNKRCKKVIKNLSGNNNSNDEGYSHDTLKYIHMDGRIIFDVQNEVKKGYSLDSYKLDNVAANFMRGKIKSIRGMYDKDDNTYIYHT